MLSSTLLGVSAEVYPYSEPRDLASFVDFAGASAFNADR